MVNVVLLGALAIRILANPLANVIQKKLSLRGYSSGSVNLHTYALLALIGMVLFVSHPLPVFGLPLLGYALLTGLFGAVGNAFLLRALESGELSVLGPINSYKSIIALFLGLVLPGEIPDWRKAPGVILIIAGSYFVIDRKQGAEVGSLFNRPDIRFRVWAMVLTAIEAVFLKKLILLSGTSVAFAIWAISGFFFSLVYSFIKKDRSPAPAKNISYFVWLLAIALGIAAMQFATIYVFKHMNVGYALAIFQLSTLVSVFLGYWYFGENNLLRKFVGSLIMIAGTLIILLG